jgi:predicted HNH restriction endonuclease
MYVNGGSITTADLQPKLRAIMKPFGEDLNILSNRNDDKFSQKVRNLKAHNTFERTGYAEYVNGVATLTDNGRRHLEQNKEILHYLLTNDFAYEDITTELQGIEKEPNKIIEVFDENTIIHEGVKRIIEKAVYERSQLLRDYAMSSFSNNGRISCSCCNFNFSDFYGTLGNNFIEIHHVKPIFQYKNDNLIKTMQEAIQNIKPVCSNCHRMIHRSRTSPLNIDDLITKINANGVYRGI